MSGRTSTVAKHLVSIPRKAGGFSDMSRSKRLFWGPLTSGPVSHLKVAGYSSVS